MGRDHLYQPAWAGRGLVCASLESWPQGTHQDTTKPQDPTGCNVSPEKGREHCSCPKALQYPRNTQKSWRDSISSSHNDQVKKLFFLPILLSELGLKCSEMEMPCFSSENNTILILSAVHQPGTIHSMLEALQGCKVLWGENPEEVHRQVNCSL